MDTLNIIVFIVLCLFLIVEIIQYRLFNINVAIFQSAVKEFNREADKYQQSFVEMTQAVEIVDSEVRGVSTRQTELDAEIDNARALLDIHSEALNLKILIGILTKLNPE